MRILVIEDEARIQAFLARGLEAEGYTVVAAGDGREGLDLATGARWDLVVLDLLLPGLNGLQVLRELHFRKPELPVVTITKPVKPALLVIWPAPCNPVKVSVRPAPTSPNTPVICPAKTDSELFFTIGAIFRFCTVRTRLPAGRRLVLRTP